MMAESLPILILGIVLVLINLVGTPLLAAKKGFYWPFWLLAGFIPCFGLFVVLVLPSANAKDLSFDERERRRLAGRNVGIGFTAFTILVAMVRGSGILDSSQSAQISTWQDQKNRISVTYDPTWKLTSTPIDGQDEVQVEFVDGSGFYLYRARVEAALPAGVDQEQVFRRMRDLVLRMNVGSQLIDERDVIFHDAGYRRMRFKLQTDKAIMSSYTYVRIAPSALIVVEWIFPSSGEGNHQVPAEFYQLDSGVELPN
jgi:hypothetical protein